MTDKLTDFESLFPKIDECVILDYLDDPDTDSLEIYNAMFKHEPSEVKDAFIQGREFSDLFVSLIQNDKEFASNYKDKLLAAYIENKECYDD